MVKAAASADISVIDRQIRGWVGLQPVISLVLSFGCFVSQAFIESPR